MAVARFASDKPLANVDTLLYTVERTALTSVVAVNISGFTRISAWIVPSGEDEAPDNWIYYINNIDLTNRNTFETFKIAVNAGDKIYASSESGQVTFFINGVYDLTGRANVTVGEQEPESPQIGDVWINPEADPQEVLYWEGSIWQGLGVEGPVGPQGPDGLPDYTGNAGKFLTTDGTEALWETVDALPAQSGNSGKYLTTDGTDPEWAFLSGGSAATEPPTIGLVDGSIWLDTDGEIQPATAKIVRWTKTATSGQTEFTGASDGSGPNLEYRPTSEQVFLNGVQLVRNVDYTASDGESIDLDAPAKVGDILQVINPSFIATTVSGISEELLVSKGDIIVASDTETPVKVSVGSTGQYLMANSATVSGVEWTDVDALPDQDANAGKFLTTDGTDASWQEVPLQDNLVLTLMGAI
jgi:hypothetical protein